MQGQTSPCVDSRIASISTCKLLLTVPMPKGGRGGVEPTPLMIFVNKFREDKGFETKFGQSCTISSHIRGYNQFGACSPKIGRGRGAELG